MKEWQKHGGNIRRRVAARTISSGAASEACDTKHFYRWCHLANATNYYYSFCAAQFKMDEGAPRCCAVGLQSIPLGAFSSILTKNDPFFLCFEKESSLNWDRS